MRKLPIPKQTSGGQWEVRWRYKVNGREHRPRRTFTTEAEANDWILRNLKSESRVSPTDRKTTFDAYADKYIEEVSATVKANTAERYRSALLHAREFFRGWPVSEIRASDCREFRARLMKGGCLPADSRSPRRMSRANSVRNVYAAFRAVLELAAEDGVLPANPAILRRTPGRKPNKQPKFRAVFLDASQVEALAAAAPEPYGFMVRFLAYTGLRAGELAGLDVADVKLWRAKETWRGYVDVHRTRRKTKSGWVEDTPKSEESTRRVELPPWLAADLAEYLSGTHERAEEPRAPLFPNRKPGATYTTGPDGRKVRGGFRLNWSEPVEPGAFYRNVFKPALAAAGLPEATRLHDLRHTFAALWLDAGGKIERLSEQMGHASYETTQKFYAHLIPPDEDAPHIFAARPAAPKPQPSNVRPLRPTGTQ
ncbi:site-specific integrase [Micromonospora orduensis]|uniref:Site-specific integrase n=1 Tax=Micromonospora orduensis TaxID=1420891 RepID=A0A5C4QH68_9ACTN|nr:tyrosine-type recombinase/integrase [Micromonospora orduensis]TNH23962.1 site-specific integrase [Micromonospora orduensis]